MNRLTTLPNLLTALSVLCALGASLVTAPAGSGSAFIGLIFLAGLLGAAGWTIRDSRRRESVLIERR